MEISSLHRATSADPLSAEDNWHEKLEEAGEYFSILMNIN